MNKFIKFLLEFGPLLVFFLLNNQEKNSVWFGYDLKPIMVATAGFIIATIISLCITYILLRKLPVMPLVSGVFIIIMGGLTLYMNDDVFIKIKPTIVNCLFGTALLIGLRFNQIFLKIIFDEGFNLTEIGWRGLTIRWGLFFYFLAAINEIVWRFFTTHQWATFKVFGIMPITIIFVLFQIKYINLHISFFSK